MPTRVVWTSEKSEQSSVADAEILLKDKHGQVPEGLFLTGRAADWRTRGHPRRCWWTFGRELHGGVSLAAGGPSARDVKVRVRFGESVSEAMAELGERGACNDHAIRDGVIDLPWLGTRGSATPVSVVRGGFGVERNPELESVRAISLMRPMEMAGSFRCSDERLNQIGPPPRARCTSAVRDYIWDGIKRDRLVWMGDMHPEVSSLMAVFGKQDVLPASLDYMRETTPADKWMNTMPSYTLWWIRWSARLVSFTPATSPTSRRSTTTSRPCSPTL
jgi:hypothetical protein